MRIGGKDWLSLVKVYWVVTIRKCGEAGIFFVYKHNQYAVLCFTVVPFIYALG